MLQGSMTGVGPALQKARHHRGVSVGEASRDTKIRPEFLEALENEDFDLLLGDVYVRGCLRSYSTYLGLDPDRVVSTYATALQNPSPAPFVAPPARLDAGISARRRRDNQRLAFLVAATLLAIAAAFGILSRSRSAPEPALLPSTPPSVADQEHRIMAALVARKEVEITVTADGERHTFTLRPQEGRSFEATTSLTIRLAQGSAVELTVNGRDLGRPGKPGHPWKRTFSYGQPEATPSPSG